MNFGHDIVKNYQHASLTLFKTCRQKKHLT